MAFVSCMSASARSDERSEELLRVLIKSSSSRASHVRRDPGAGPVGVWLAAAGAGRSLSQLAAQVTGV